MPCTSVRVQHCRRAELRVGKSEWPTLRLRDWGQGLPQEPNSLISAQHRGSKIWSDSLFANEGIKSEQHGCSLTEPAGRAGWEHGMVSEGGWGRGRWSRRRQPPVRIGVSSLTPAAAPVGRAGRRRRADANPSAGRPKELGSRIPAPPAGYRLLLQYHCAD